MKKKVEKIILQYRPKFDMTYTHGEVDVICSTILREILKVLPKEIKFDPDKEMFKLSFDTGFNQSLSDCKSAISKLLK